MASSEFPPILNLNLAALKETLISWGEPAFRANQVWQGLYQQLWDSPDDFLNLPTGLRKKLFESFSFSPLTPLQSLSSKDGETNKTLFLLADGKTIETVLMGYEKRSTLCISTQSGCALGCLFCATGQMGFQRNLSPGEIIKQVLFFAEKLKKNENHLTNIVLMGMGEPFLNYDATLEAVDRLNDPAGFNMGARRFTISTVGIVPKILQFTTEKRQINLAVSLHAANNELRSTLLPVNKKYPLNELIAACRTYIDQTHRRVSFEWALIQDINDTPEQAHLLVHLLKGMLCHVNLIQLNPTRKYQGRSTPRNRAEMFQSILLDAGIQCTIRLRRGLDIMAGCGQLASENKLA